MEESKVRFSCEKYQFSFDDYLRLYKEQKLYLGVDIETSNKLIDFYPEIFGKTGIRAAKAFYLFLLLAFGLLTIVLSFIYFWWVFFIGIVAWLVMSPILLRSNTKNVLSLLAADKNAYMAAIELKVLLYEMRPSDMPEPLRKKFQESQAL